MMGNRGGKFHRDDKTLGKRRWASTHWICCELEWKGAHHEPMGQGYASLFFSMKSQPSALATAPVFSAAAEKPKLLSARAGFLNLIQNYTHNVSPSTKQTSAICRMVR